MKLTDDVCELGRVTFFVQITLDIGDPIGRNDIEQQYWCVVREMEVSDALDHKNYACI